MEEENATLSRIDELIMDILTKSNKPLTTYKIAKEAKLSWATVNIHCYKLMSYDILKNETFDIGAGQKRILWRLTAKTPTLDKFIQ